MLAAIDFWRFLAGDWGGGRGGGVAAVIGRTRALLKIRPVRRAKSGSVAWPWKRKEF